MKVWIGTDMEGVAGVVDREHTARDGREHDRARIWLTDEVNAAYAGYLGHHAMYVELAVMLPGCRQTGARTVAYSASD